MSGVIYYSDRVVFPEGERRAAILVQGETIAAIADTVEELLLEAPAAAVEDVRPAVLMPGLVDSHIHVNDPQGEWERWEEVTRACVQGGVTTLVDMPLNSIPVTTTVAAAVAKQQSVAGRVSCDVGLLGGVVPAMASPAMAGEAERMVTETGVLGFKFFTCHSGLDAFPGCGPEHLEAIGPQLQAVRAKGFHTVLMAHAEHEEELAEVQPNAADHNAWESSRPPDAEVRAVKDIVVPFAERFRVPTHVVHVSAAEVIPLRNEAQKAGIPLTIETTYSYLYFLAENVPRAATPFKCAPPLRSRANNDALWAAVGRGEVDCIVSDHSPCPPEMKFPGGHGTFDKAWGGISSAGLGLRAVLTAGAPHGMTLVDVARHMALHTARLVGLDTVKGSIAVGKHADLVVLLPADTVRIDANDLQFLHRVSPYVGHYMRGRIVRTILRGHTVFDAGVFAAPSGALLMAAPGPSVNIRRFPAAE